MWSLMTARAFPFIEPSANTNSTGAVPVIYDFIARASCVSFHLGAI